MPMTVTAARAAIDAMSTDEAAALVCCPCAARVVAAGAANVGVARLAATGSSWSARRPSGSRQAAPSRRCACRLREVPHRGHAMAGTGSCAKSRAMR